MQNKTETPTTQTTETLPPADVPANLDDFAAFALPPGREAVVAAEKLLTSVPVKKPNREWWVRTSPDLATWRAWPVLELKEDGDTYLVHEALHAELVGEPAFVAVRLVPAVTDNGVAFFWPVRLPDASGKINSWHESAARAAELARERWVRLVADRTLGGYQVFTAQFEREPQWPKQSQAELLKIAFQGRLLESTDHPVVKRLKGLA